MILCIDNKQLKTSSKVQKDINLEELIIKHTKYFDSVEEALKEEYVPLDFSISVRSTYTNQVLQTTTEKGVRYYTNLAEIQEFIHKGYDLIMYLASIGLMHNVYYEQGFDELMMKHSQFMPIGIYYPHEFVINPIVYSHIIMSDEGAEKLKEFLRDDRKFVSIKEMRDNSVGNITPLLDTIIEVKEESKDE